jgi:hypothetical protein
MRIQRGQPSGRDSQTADKLLKLHYFRMRGFAAKTHPYTQQKVPLGSIP